MIKTRLYKPYDSAGNTTFPDRKRPGVYIFYKSGKPVYVGKSESDLYKAMYRHLQIWNDPNQQRIVYNRQEVKIRVVYCTVLQARRLEAALIRHYKPADNLNTPEPVTFSERSLQSIAADFFGTEAEPLTDLPF